MLGTFFAVLALMITPSVGYFITVDANEVTACFFPLIYIPNFPGNLLFRSSRLRDKDWIDVRGCGRRFPRYRRQSEFHSSFSSSKLQKVFLKPIFRSSHPTRRKYTKESANLPASTPSQHTWTDNIPTASETKWVPWRQRWFSLLVFPKNEV